MQNISSKYSASVVVFGAKNFGVDNTRFWLSVPVINRSFVASQSNLDHQRINNFIKNKFDSKLFIDVSNIFCNDSYSCPVFNDGYLITSDGLHLTNIGARILGDALQVRYGKILQLVD